MNYLFFRRSFANRVSFWVLITTMIVYVLSFGVGLWFAGDKMLQEGHEKANLELDKAIAFIDKELTNVEIAGRNLAYLYPKDEKMTKEKAFAAFRNFLQQNPEIQGVIIALEPDECPESPTGFAPYLTNIDDTIQEMMLNEYRSYKDSAWYKNTKMTDKKNWSDPFLEYNGTVICSYCIPLHNSSGKFIGVLTLDISLNDLTEKLQSTKPFPNSMVTLMDDDYDFIVHPNKKYILNESAMSLIQKANYNPLAELKSY